MPGAAQATTTSSAHGNGRQKKGVKAESRDFDDDFDNNAPQRKPNGKAKKPPKKKAKEESDNFNASSDEDKPIITKKPPVSRKRKVKNESDLNASSDDEKPLAKKPAAKPRGKKVKEEDASSSDTPKLKKKAAKVKKEEANGSPVKGKGKKKEKEGQEPEQVFRWWEADPNDDGSVKWQTLEHNGVIFPPPYEPLPKNVKMKYNGIHHVFLYPPRLSYPLPRQGCQPLTSCRGSRWVLCGDDRNRPRAGRHLQ